MRPNRWATCSRSVERTSTRSARRGRTRRGSISRAISGGAEHVVFDPDRFARSSKEHYSIDYYSPSPAGRYVAIGISEGGSEKTVLHVIDARSGKLLPDVIERAIYNPPSWRDDGRSFFYFRTPKAPPNQPQSETRHQRRRAAARARPRRRPRPGGLRVRGEPPHPVRPGGRARRQRLAAHVAGRWPRSPRRSERGRRVRRAGRVGVGPARRRGAGSPATPTT